MTDNTFIFIGGLHKSGTTLLFELLREHPQFSGFKNTGVPRDEGQHLQSVYPSASAHGGPGRFGFDRSAHLTESSRLVTGFNRQTLLAEWEKYWDTAKPFLVEKSPGNLIRARFLQAMFPNSRFVILRRHPIPVALATVKWSRTSLYSLMKHWIICHQIWEQDKPFVREFIEVRYEDLVSDPVKEMNRICAFLGADELPEVARAASPSFNEGYFQTWKTLKRERCIMVYIKFIERAFQRQIQRFGYSFYPDTKPSGPLAAHGVRDAW